MIGQVQIVEQFQRMAGNHHQADCRDDGGNVRIFAPSAVEQADDEEHEAEQVAKRKGGNIDPTPLTAASAALTKTTAAKVKMRQRSPRSDRTPGSLPVFVEETKTSI